MSTTVRFERGPLDGSGSSKGRSALRCVLASVLLLAGLIAYCELCSLVLGLPAPGLRISGPWAVQVATPWIVIGTTFGCLGARIGTSRIAHARPGLVIVTAIFAIAAFALLSEALLMRWLDGDADALVFMYERAPVCIAASALLVAVYVGNRSLRHRMVERVEWLRPVEPVPDPTQRQSTGARPAAIEVAGPNERQPGDVTDAVLEVMTGTGRTSVRLEDVECLQADRNYINVIHVSGRTYLLRKTMAAAETSLDPARFVRIHRSMIVNRHMIRERRAGGVLVLRSGRCVSIGRAFRHRLDMPTTRRAD